MTAAETADIARDQPGMAPSSKSPMVFLVGPPGAGKSTLGRRVCAELGLRFFDLADDGRTDAALQELIAIRGADVVALPWVLANDTRRLALCRRSGETVALWAHPLDMQARSGRAESLFTPVKGLRTHGGFGHRGTRCPEYRRLERACEHVLLLVGMAEDAAAEELKAMIDELRTQEAMPPAEREGLLGWRDGWREDLNADAEACEVLVDAMARFVLHLKAQGASPRKLAGVYGDLQDAGFLVLRDWEPKGKDVLVWFGVGPSEYEYRRKISDSPRALAGLRATWDAFAAFLRNTGMIEDEREP